MEDDELLAQMRAGKKEAFTELVARYHSLLVRLATFHVHNKSTAEDVAQETWIAVMRGVEKFEGRSSFKTWLLRICVNRARSTAQREARTVVVDTTWSDGNELAQRFDSEGMWREPPAPFTDAIDNTIVSAPIIKKVRTAISHLPDVPRMVVTLRDVEGLSTQEVATLLDISDANVRVILHRGRSRVRSEVETVMTQARS